MRAIKVNCGACQKQFEFSHPSVRDAHDMYAVTIDCRHCGAVLKVPDDEITMISMAQYMTRSARAAGLLTEEQQIDPHDIGVIEVDFQKRSRVTPAIMPPHPPALPKRPSQRDPQPLHQRPFRSLRRDQFFDQEKD